MQETATPVPPVASVWPRRLPWFWITFAGVAVIQTLHFGEHIAQVIQYYVIGLPRSHSHGIIGQLDLELVHFVFDLWLVVALSVVYVLGKERIDAQRGVFRASFFALLFTQSYHMVEHIAKFAQYLQTGEQGTPGFFGNIFVNPLWFHFWLNFVVLALILATFAHLALQSWRARQAARVFVP